MKEADSTHTEDLARQATVAPLPKELETEAGVILDVAGTHIEGIKLAKDGHVSSKQAMPFF